MVSQRACIRHSSVMGVSTLTVLHPSVFCILANRTKRLKHCRWWLVGQHSECITFTQGVREDGALQVCGSSRQLPRSCVASLPLRLVSLRCSGHHVVHHSVMNRNNPACIVRGITEDLHRNTSTAEQQACWRCYRRCGLLQKVWFVELMYRGIAGLEPSQ